MRGRRPRVAVLYHYFHPDDVVSARHFGDFCADLAARGWQVEALPCNRGCRDEGATYPPREDWHAVAIRRVWRPRFRQASSLGRLLNTAWMLAAWGALGLRDPRHAPDVLVVGTDPAFAVLVAPVLKALYPRLRIAHWAFDLYPESVIAEGMVRGDGLPVRLLRPLLGRAYATCDLVADLGSCMRARLEGYGHPARKVTLVPWALAEPAAVEPPDPAVRRGLFGDARLGLLYSGNFGRAHSYAEILGLARRLRGEGVHFSFGVRGNRADELRGALGSGDANVTLAGFAPEAELVKRLSAADIHLVSLRPEWTGLVVPSKFFGSLASGRPVLFAGSRDSAVARWIRELGVGWVLDDRSQGEVAAALRALRDRPERLAELQRHCHRVYHEHFSRRKVMADWHRELQALLPPGRPAPAGRNGGASKSAAVRPDPTHGGS
jgi:glycosyltransferase involved in cell wall biosynthesis